MELPSTLSPRLEHRQVGHIYSSKYVQNFHSGVSNSLSITSILRERDGAAAAQGEARGGGSNNGVNAAICVLNKT